MAKTHIATVFHLDRPFNGKNLKKVFKDAGYSDTAMAETLGISCIHERQDVEVISRRVKTDSPYNILFRLFWLGRAVSESLLRKILPGLNVEELEGIGLLVRRDGMIRSTAKL
ncbi:MAG: hypothetical protein V3U02_02775, partial [Calditrichia bacterium]